MKRKHTDAVEALRDAERTVWSLEQIVCDTCTDVCWTASVVTHGRTASEFYDTWLLHREHLAQADALVLLGRWTMGKAATVLERNAAVRFHELQGQLW